MRLYLAQGQVHNLCYIFRENIAACQLTTFLLNQVNNKCQVKLFWYTEAQT